MYILGTDAIQIDKNSSSAGWGREVEDENTSLRIAGKLTVIFTMVC